MNKENDSLSIIIIVAIIIAVLAIIGLLCQGCTPNIERPYDPNAPELSFLEAIDPNWARDYGYTRETRELYNLSKVRAMLLRDEQITAEIARRLIALENYNKAYFDFSGWDPNDGPALCYTDPNEPFKIKGEQK